MGGGAKNAKRFERSNGLDNALYKNIPFYHHCSGSWPLMPPRLCKLDGQKTPLGNPTSVRNIALNLAKKTRTG